MLKYLKNKSRQYFLLLMKWIVISLVMGVVGGIVGTLFVLGVAKSNEFWTGHKNMIYLLPFGGLIIVYFYHFLDFKNPKGTNRIFDKIRSDEELSIIVAPLIFISTIITHIFGGSAGREGAAVQIGGSIGSGMSKILKLDDKDTSILVISGVTAVFSALFGTPITAIFFALEVISVGIIYYAGLIPCFITSIVAFAIGMLCDVEYLVFEPLQMENIEIFMILKVAVLGIILGIVSIGVVKSFSSASKYSKKYMKNSYIRVFVGGVIVVILTMIFSDGIYNGSSENMIVDAFEGKSDWWNPIIKLLFTSVTLGFGFKGGEIIPTFIVGATVGATAGSLLGLPIPLSVGLGLIGGFCGAVNCPIASIVLSIELFGGANLIYFVEVCAISYAFSGYYSLYSSQKIVYSKFKAQFLNINARH